jgi:hypothetical protein
MKKTIFLFIALTILLISCVMEPPTTRFSFRIINRTGKYLFIDCKDIKYNEFSIDTIKPNQTYEKVILQLGCFKDYKDTLIKSFFSELKIRIDSGNLHIDPYMSAKWKDSIDLKGIGNCKGGNAYYSLTIDRTNLK